MHSGAAFPIMTADDVAGLIPDGSMVAFSGFTPAGAAKAVPQALARRAKSLHDAGQPYKLRVLTGASTGRTTDDALAEVEAISWRAPFQSSIPLREQINDGRVAFVDMHLSHLPQSVLFGFFGKIDFAVIEATEITTDGRVYLSTSIGASPTFLQAAEKVVIEVNRRQPPRISETADILVPEPPPFRRALNLDHPLQRIGRTYADVEPQKIIGVVLTDEPDERSDFTPTNDVCKAIARHVVEFLVNELACGRVPPEFLPIQSGVGNLANAVLKGIGDSPEIPDFLMYSEVLQSAAFEMISCGRVRGASTCALVLTPSQTQQFEREFNYFARRIVLRPQEISNNPAIVRQLGVIALNTALEIDLFGHVNSTHVCGQRVINGIGGSGDFARNSYLTIFMCPSIAKQGIISTIVPMCTHVDHNEHSVHVVVTEQGFADLRGLAPQQRAQLIIERCAHPMYRDYLNQYLRESGPGHIRHDLSRCFEFHHNLSQYGSMLPDRFAPRAPLTKSSQPRRSTA
jgi:succinate CoA transferase